jgi:hypothetical protein
MKITKTTPLLLSLLAVSLLLGSSLLFGLGKKTLLPPDFMIAFIGDQGLTDNSREVLQLIKDEGADMVLHQGDFDYKDDPEAWDQMINDILGPNFPYFASIGNHDYKAWPGYQQKLRARLDRIQDAMCTIGCRDHGVRP